MAEQANRLRVVVVSPMSTLGLRVSDNDFASLLRDAGADVRVVGPESAAAGRPAGLLRRLANRIGPVADVTQSWQLRRALRRALHDLDAVPGREPAVVFTTVGGTFFVGRRVLRRSALRFDALSCENRGGLQGWPIRQLERRAMRHLAVLLPLSSVRGTGLARERFFEGRTVIPMPPPIDKVPPPIDKAPPPSAPVESPAAVDACLAYVGDPAKKGLDLLVEGFQRSKRDGRRLTVVGVDPAVARGFLTARGIALDEERVSLAGTVSRDRFLAMLGTCRLYVSSSRYEDFGAAQLEALLAGAPVVATPARGPFEVGAILRGIDPALVAADSSPQALAETIDYALALEPDAVAARRSAAQRALAPFLLDTLRRRVDDELLPRLIALSG